MNSWMYGLKKRLNLHPGAESEEEFGHYFVGKHLSILRFGIMVSIFLFALLGIDDIWAAPVSKHETWGIRYGLMVPFLLLSYGVTYTAMFRRHQQTVMVIVQLVSGSGSIAIIAVLRPEEPASYFYFAGLMLILFANFTMFGLRWIQATAVSALLAAGHAAAVFFAHNSSHFDVTHVLYLSHINGNLYVLSTLFGSAVVGYVMERYKIVEFVQRKELERKNEVMERLSYKDGLTGVSNRRAFDARIAEEWSLALKNGRSLSLIMIDIDLFKPYNDAYGHLKGDDCLIAVASALQSGLKRSRDFVARYGGEEFAVILPGVDEDGARGYCAALHEAVNRLGLEHPASRVGHVTISAGVATARPQNDQYRPWLEAADRALYESKSKGGNCTMVG